MDSFLSRVEWILSCLVAVGMGLFTTSLSFRSLVAPILGNQGGAWAIGSISLYAASTLWGVACLYGGITGLMTSPSRFAVKADPARTCVIWILWGLIFAGMGLHMTSEAIRGLIPLILANQWGASAIGSGLWNFASAVMGTFCLLTGIAALLTAPSRFAFKAKTARADDLLE